MAPLQNLITCFPSIALGWRAGAQSQGRDQILPSGNTGVKSKPPSPVFGDVGCDLDEVCVVARDPLGVVAHLAPGLSQVGPHAGDVGGQGAHVGAHRRDEGIHAPAMI